MNYMTARKVSKMLAKLTGSERIFSYLSFFIHMMLLYSVKASRRNCPPNMMARYKMEIQGTWTDAGLTGQLLPRGFPLQWRWLTGIGVSLDEREDPYYNETIRTKLYNFVKKGGLSTTVTGLTQPASGVLDTFLLPPLDSSMGESSSIFFVDTNHSHVSFMSRMNHKPHWILSVESVDLCQNGQFREAFELDLFPFENKPRIVQRSHPNNVPQSVPPIRQSFSGYEKNYRYPNNVDTNRNRPHQDSQNNQRHYTPTRKYFRQNGEPSLVAPNTRNSVYRSNSDVNGPIYLHNIHNQKNDRQELVTPAHFPTAGHNAPATTRNQTANQPSTTTTTTTTAKPSTDALRFLTFSSKQWTTTTTKIHPFLSYSQIDLGPEALSKERLNRPEPHIHRSDPYINIIDATPSTFETISLTSTSTTTTTSASTSPTTKTSVSTTEADILPTVRSKRPGYRVLPIIKSAPSNSRRRLPPDSENEIFSSRNRRAVRYGQPADPARSFISTAGDIRPEFSQPSRFVPNTYRVPHNQVYNHGKNQRSHTPEVMPRLATVKFTRLAIYQLSHVSRPGRRRLSGRNGHQVPPLPITIDKSLINLPHLPYPANPLRSPVNMRQRQFDRQRPSSSVSNESGSHLRRPQRLLTQPSYPF